MKNNLELKNIPLLNNKDYTKPSIFNAENLLREARRQKNISLGKMPQICILDPDGDIVVNLTREGKAKLDKGWACYHTSLYKFIYDDIEFGIIGCAVGASFAVLVAEELFACECQFLISMTSAGQIIPLNRRLPYFVLIKKALRDEGTSYHYLSPSQYSHIDKKLLEVIGHGLEKSSVAVCIGASWTTDAPFRETEYATEYARSEGILAVEMEAAALYAFASVKNKSIVCLAHVTNQMGNPQGDFEKGLNSGSTDALKVISLIARRWLDHKDKS